MSNFFETMKTTALNDVNFNGAYTENGALGFATTGKALLDMNFQVASLRHASESEIKAKFLKAYAEDPRMAILWLFYARDVRGGLGERRLFRICITEILDKIAQVSEEARLEFLKLIPEYGRFDDLICLIKLFPAVEDLIVKILDEQLSKDLRAFDAKKPISLLAKWMPSEKASNKVIRSLSYKLMKAFDMSPKEYRQMLSKLRKYIDVTEIKMSAQNWNEINYSQVPARASLLYKNAFKFHDLERYTNFISKVNKGEAKINASVLYPHDIVAKYMYTGGWSEAVEKYDASLEALWKNLPNTVNGNGSTIVVADGSGSMTSKVNNSATALDIANALAIYFSERCSGEFKNKYITFSEHPRFVDFSNLTSLHDKLEYALQFDECANTNIEAVFDLILKTAVRNNMTQKDLPSNVLIISDMEFDYCADSTTGNVDKALFQVLAERYAEHGYKLPRLVFWNVNSRTGTIPIIQNDLGVALVSGFSVNIAKMVIDNELDPYKCLTNMLESDRYKAISETLQKF